MRATRDADRGKAAAEDVFAMSAAWDAFVNDQRHHNPARIAGAVMNVFTRGATALAKLIDPPGEIAVATTAAWALREHVGERGMA